MSYSWEHLNHLQVGRYAEYFIKMELARRGFDLYSPEVDDKGIDLLIRCNDSQHHDIQVKSIRGYNYVFFPKSKFHLRPNLFGAVVIFLEGKPPLAFLVPSEAWREPNALLCERDYEGLKSKPEWGVNLSNKNMPFIEQYSIEHAVRILTGDK